MARRPRTRRRDRGPVPVGKVYIQSTFNNTIVTLTDQTGNAVAWGSAGTAGFRGSRKSTAFAAQRAGEDAAKKAIEQGHISGAEKGDDAHDAAVIGDTIGDPFKDTSGPSLNILIKLMSIVAVVGASSGLF